MIVMKFGGTSVAEGRRILGVAEIVRDRLDRGPIVVVSALAGVTDLILAAIETAKRGDREALDPILADLERRHRWALTGALEDSRQRHDIALEVDRLFEELRQLLRSVRILGEGTPRAADALLAFGETLSARIVTAVLLERGIPARWVDPRDVMITDSRHGAAEPVPESVAVRCRERLLPLVGGREVPVLGGFVGATPDGRTTTLGRGGSDTTASAVGAAVGADEIQIWTDVDGLMSADPRLVPAARTLPEVSFAEAAELAYYGAKVLHPASIAPAVRQGIPVRILNSLRPDGAGTVVLPEVDRDAPGLASVASRGGLALVRAVSRRMRMDPKFLRAVLDALEKAGVVPDLVTSSEVSVAVVIPREADLSGMAESLGEGTTVEWNSGRAILCVVGAGLHDRPGARARVLSVLSGLDPEVVAVGGSSTSVAAVVSEDRLAEAVRELHRRFFEAGEPGP